MWTKKLPDGSISSGMTVQGPDFYLGLDDRVGVDGWVWVDDLGTPVVEVPKPVIDKLEQDVIVAQTQEDYDTAVSTFLSSVAVPK